MKFLLKKYKLAFRFVLTFLVVYSSFSLLYYLYLRSSDGVWAFPDFITHLVAVQAKYILTQLGYLVQVLPNSTELTLKFIINGNYVVRIVEGCNAVSVIILFVSFVIAFSGKFKTTIYFVVFGSVIIYTVNLFRIAFLSLWLYKHPEHLKVLHDVVFPLVIYGAVFLLWFFWVNNFSEIKKNDD